MISQRETHLTQRFNEFLDRFAPPRSIANNPTAMQQDADDMLRTVLRYAPSNGYSEWLDRVLRDLQEGMTTRSWPAPGELARACKAASSVGQPQGAASNTEGRVVDMMADWHAKFGTEMPRMGKPERTAELIRRGVLASERDAHFKRYTLSAHQERRAVEQPPTRDEWRHHVRVTARLRGISEAEAEASLRMDSRAPMDRSGAAIPDLSAPYDRNRFAA